MTSRDIYRLTAGALLLALSLVIPLALGGAVSLTLGPFTATPASHVPILLSMLFGPLVAGVVAFGSALGFFIKLGPVVGFRAAMHIPFAIAGALLIRKKVSFPATLAIVAPLHAGLEALVVLLFGYTLQKAGWIVGVGTLAHHTFDSLIALFLWKVLSTRNAPWAKAREA